MFRLYGESRNGEKERGLRVCATLTDALSGAAVALMLANLSQKTDGNRQKQSAIATAAKVAAYIAE